jgi:deoxyribose-phosphate aldolase
MNSFSSYIKMIKPYPVDQVGVDERAERFTKRSIKKDSKMYALKLALSMLDLTSLDARDTPSKVKQLCAKALRPSESLPGLPSVAAVCVYPNLVSVAKDALKKSTVKVAAVATSFPSGMTSKKLKIEETRWAVSEGADEIDMVISRGKFLSGDYKYVFEEIEDIKSACGNARLKVILETGELDTYTNIRKASMLAMYAGADFIKTSTGKINPAATLPVTLVMLEAIRDFYTEEGRMIGMKPAGGISTSKLAIHYLVMVREILGDAWLTSQYFRFGASSLANDLLMQIEKLNCGIYQSVNYFSQD